MSADAMHRCLELAREGRGCVGNGALVGAVLVRDGVIIAEGLHTGFGKPHAERQLLEKFEQKISSSDTLYVNLEPCCHHGKTPPCTDIIIDRGIKHVVYGMRDPDQRVSGQGIAALQNAGVDVTGPVERAACEWLNRGFISVRTKGRPWITLKQAIAADGSISNPDGSPKAITSAAQNAWSHARLRATHDAILVGVGTILSDNPQLTVRDTEVAVRPRRIVLDPHGRIPSDAKVLTDEHHARTIVVGCTGSAGFAQAKDALLQTGVTLLEVDMTADSSLALHQLWPQLLSLDGGAGGITSILVEGGRKTWLFFRSAGVLDMQVILAGKC